jgi:mannose-6-phosphate isomerase
MQHVEYSTDTNLLSEFIDFINKQGNKNIKAIVKEMLSSSKGVEIAVALTQGLSKMNNRDSTYDDVRMLIEISSFFPNDVGVTIATLMNPVTLRKGEALFLPAGNMHAYLSGIGIEIMANSDNVLRGGLTTKYIDTDELVEILDASILKEPVYAPEVLRGVNMYKPVSDFTVYDAKVKLETVDIHGQDCIAVALENSTLKFDKEEVKLLKGEAVLITGEASVTVKGHIVFTF